MLYNRDSKFIILIEDELHINFYKTYSFFGRQKNYSTPESAVPHYRSFAYYRLMRQDHAEATNLVERIYASTIGSPTFDEHRPIYKNSFEELRGTLNKGFLLFYQINKYIRYLSFLFFCVTIRTIWCQRRNKGRYYPTNDYIIKNILFYKKFLRFMFLDV